MARAAERSVEYWKNAIHRGIAYQEKYGNSRDWSQWDKFYKGEWGTLNQSLPMNFMFSLFRTSIPQTYFRDPRVNVIARKYGMEAAARVLESIDNWLIQEMNLKAHFKRAMLYAMLHGTGILKVGYDSEFGMQRELLEGVVETEFGMADLSNETLTGRNLKDFTRTEYNASVVPGRPWALPVHARDFILEPGALSIDEARWCAHRILRPVDDVRLDEKYDPSERKKVEPGQMESYKDHDAPRLLDWADDADTADIPNNRGSDVLKDKNRDEFAELWEIHDAKSETVKVITMDGKDYLRDEVDELQIDGLPFVAFSFNPSPDSFWGISDAQVLHPQQEELNDIRELQQRYRREGLRKLITRRGALSEEAKKALKSAKPDAFVELDNMDAMARLADQIIVMERQLPADIMAWGEQITQDMRDLAGLGRNQMGDYDSSSRRSATEAGIVQQNAQIRIDERRDIMADVLTRVMRKCNQMVFKFWTAPQVARVTGPDGAMHWVQYTGEEIQGEYDYRVEPDDALPLTKQTRQQQSVALFQAIAPVLMQMGPPMMPGVIELARNVLMKHEDMNPDAIIPRPQMPTGAPPIDLQTFGALQPQGMMGQGMMPQGMPPQEGAMNAGISPTMQGMQAGF